MADETTNIILYPRSYNRRGEASSHSVHGITQEGEEVSIKLRPPEGLNESTVIPTVTELARTDRKARFACLATPENSSTNPEGVMLFTQCAFTNLNSKGMRAYEANWVYVLAADKESPAPVIGMGRIAVNTNYGKLAALREELKTLDEDSERADDIRRETCNPANYGYSAVVYDHWGTKIIEPGDVDGLTESMVTLMNKHHKSGVIGGVMVRAMIGDQVVRDHVIELFPGYVTDERRYQKAEDIVATFLDTYEEWANFQLDVMPLKKINCGPRGNEFYSSPEMYSRLREKYFGDDYDYLICPVAVSVTHYADTDNTLLYRMHSVANTMLHPALLARDGEPLRFVRDASHVRLIRSKTQLPENERELGEQQIGYTLRMNELLSVKSAQAYPLVDEMRADSKKIEEPQTEVVIDLGGGEESAEPPEEEPASEGIVLDFGGDDASEEVEEAKEEAPCPATPEAEPEKAPEEAPEPELVTEPEPAPESEPEPEPAPEPVADSEKEEAAKPLTGMAAYLAKRKKS